MDHATRYENPVDRHESNTLVADTAHVRLVKGILPRLIEGEEWDDRLGLTLLTLKSADAAADAVLEQRPDVLKQRPDLGQPRPGDWTGVDRLLENLRAAFEYEYGWTPSMGKNRIMTAVQAVTYPNAGGAGGPEATTSLASLRKADMRRYVPPEAGAGVRVGLPDTRFYPHPRLAGRYVVAEPVESRLAVKPKGKSGWSYIDGHGAFVASLILREAPSARLDVRPVIATPAAARCDADRSVWEVARRMVGYLDSGVQVINCSWACLTWDNKPPFVLERAVGLLTPTILVIAAASNHGRLLAAADDTDGPVTDREWRENQLPERYAPAYPAALPNVVAVGALDGDNPATFNPVVRRNEKAPGKEKLAPWIDVLAQGVDTVGAYFGDTSATRRRPSWSTFP